MKKLKDYLRNTNITKSNLKELFLRYNQSSFEDKFTSFSTFKKIIRSLGLKYKKVKKTKRKNINLKSIDWYGKELIRVLKNKNFITMFFDTSSIGESNFKNMAWNFIKSDTILKNKFSYNLLHILSCISTKDLVGIQFIKGNLINLDFVYFLKNIKSSLRQKLKRKQIALILDNAASHHTNVFKNFAAHEKIKLIYTPPNCPDLNPIEYLFRYIKSGIRKEFSLKKYI